ncbi:hypothetical protein [Xaviernesmea oryzae]|uniref:hypothetical protein n=1 Tax=Xaviernesmea oryzae TaxID=464029 RepID=UPI000AF9EC6B|nr:hypothetical protein [Xaviernesmea oryzae]
MLENFRGGSPCLLRKIPAIVLAIIERPARLIATCHGNLSGGANNRRHDFFMKRTGWAIQAVPLTLLLSYGCTSAETGRLVRPLNYDWSL